MFFHTSILHIVCTGVKCIPLIINSNPPFEITRLKNEEKIDRVAKLSSGESEILALSLDLLTICGIWELEKQQKRVLLIDEPDMHLHPDLQQNFAHFIFEVLNKFNIQILVATHSTTLLSALGYYGGERTSVIYLNNNIDEQKTIKFNYILKELSVCLGGHALMGPLFGAPILLVEGDDDYKIWSYLPRYQNINVAVIPCGGKDEVKKYQSTLEKLFASLRDEIADPVGFALLDGDETLPSPNDINKQINIKFLKLNCLESENLYLTNEVLGLMGINWETAKEKIQVYIENNPINDKERKEILKNCNNWDIRKEDIKSIINILENIFDEKRLPWTIRVAQGLGKTPKPEGQLADFLGEGLIDALW